MDRLRELGHVNDDTDRVLSAARLDMPDAEAREGKLRQRLQMLVFEMAAEAHPSEIERMLESLARLGARRSQLVELREALRVRGITLRGNADADLVAGRTRRAASLARIGMHEEALQALTAARPGLASHAARIAMDAQIKRVTLPVVEVGPPPLRPHGFAATTLAALGIFGCSWITCLIVAAWLVYFALEARCGIRTSQRGIAVQEPVRRLEIPWRDVRDVAFAVTRVACGQDVKMTLYLDGVRVRIEGVDAQPDGPYQRLLNAVLQACQAGTVARASVARRAILARPSPPTSEGLSRAGMPA